MGSFATDIPDVRLDFAESGHPEGPVVLVLHGLSSSRANDAAVGFDWARALPTHRVISYDARGHGRSEGRTEPEDYTWPALAEDLLALADEFSPDHPVDVIGASMGVGTILHAVLKRPDRFRRLVLAIPPTAWAGRVEQQKTYAEAADLVERHGLARFNAVRRMQPSPPAASEESPDPDVREDLFPSVLRGAADSDLPEPFELAAITQPTLLLAWVEDPGHPLTTAEQLADLIPHAQLRVAQDQDDVAGWPELADAFLSSIDTDRR